MKKHIQQALLMLLGISMLGSIHSCKKDKCNDPTNPDCENYDPCFEKKTINYGFTFGTQWNTPESFFDTLNYIHVRDSLFINNNRIRFTAHSEYDSVVWNLGSETIRENSFVRIFNNAPEGYYYCKMIGFRAKQPCLPNDDGIDTIVKRWYMMPIPKLPIMGKFKVLFKGADDSSIVEILPWNTAKFWTGVYPNQTSRLEIYEKESNSGYITLVNFLNNGDTTASNDLQSIYGQMISGHWLILNDKGGKNTPIKGYFKLANNLVEAKYRIFNYKPFTSETVYTDLEFKGRKID